MRKNKVTKILMTCVVCGTVALNFSPVFAANNYWSAQAINDFLSNKIEAPSVLKDEKYKKAITREDFAQLIVGIYAKSNNMDKGSIKTKKTPFKDTTNIDVQRAYSLGIIQGVGKTTFDPNNNITREQIATMLTRFLNIKKIDTSSTNNLNSFTDKSNISNWAFKLKFNWNNINDNEKIIKDLNYMFNKKFKVSTSQIQGIIEAVIKTKQGVFYSDDFTINESKKYKIWVSGDGYTTEIYIENDTDMGEIPPIPSPQNHP